MAKQGEKIKLISAHAKKIWKKAEGEKWTDAIKRASAELKKDKKIFFPNDKKILANVNFSKSQRVILS